MGFYMLLLCLVAVKFSIFEAEFDEKKKFF